MARGKQAERRCCHTERPFARPSRTRASITREYDRFTRYAGIILGVAFGIMFALGLIAG